MFDWCYGCPTLTHPETQESAAAKVMGELQQGHSACLALPSWHDSCALHSYCTLQLTARLSVRPCIDIEG